MLIDASYPDIYLECQRKMRNKGEDAWIITSICQYTLWYEYVRKKKPLRFEPFVRERFRVQFYKCVEESPLFKLRNTENDYE